MTKDSIDHRCKCGKFNKSHGSTCFNWIQIIISLLVPISIAIYTFLQNDNDRTIAMANREKDLEIARSQRAQDLQIAEDQQNANILAVYERFLVDHLNRYGMTLNGTASARYVVRFKTLATLSQLDRNRKTFLIRSIYEGKLIVIDNETADPTSSGIISLEEADLSDIIFDNRALKYFSVPKANLTGASFFNAILQCVNFFGAILTNTNFVNSTLLSIEGHCFKKSTKYSRSIFISADMTNANFYHADFIATDFSEAILDGTNMRNFVCLNCLFFKTYIMSTDLSFARMSMGCNFTIAKLERIVLNLTSFNRVVFERSELIGIQGTDIDFQFCTFTAVYFINCTLRQSLFIESSFSTMNFIGINIIRSNLNNVNFSYLKLLRSNFSDTIFNQCIFKEVDFNDTILTNTSFFNCTFQQTSFSSIQQSQIASFDGNIFL